MATVDKQKRKEQQRKARAIARYSKPLDFVLFEDYNQEIEDVLREVGYERD